MPRSVHAFGVRILRLSGLTQLVSPKAFRLYFQCTVGSFKPQRYVRTFSYEETLAAPLTLAFHGVAWTLSCMREQLQRWVLWTMKNIMGGSLMVSKPLVMPGCYLKRW